MSSSYGIHSGMFHPVLRSWQCPASPSSDLRPSQLILPLFVIESPDAVEPVPSLPGVSRFGVNELVKFVAPLEKKGLQAVLLFSVVSEGKCPNGNVGYSSRNPLFSAVRALKQHFPGLLVSCDVCLCTYTDHGHCGVLQPDGFIDNAKSLEQLAKISKACVEAGADVIAPSDMNDGRIGAIKQMLKRENWLNKACVMSYTVKFASSFYGPFRDAANSAPTFGDRQRYQLPVGSNGLGIRAADRDVEEGADILMVKPGLAFLDVVRDVKQRHPQLPMAIYQVSGEYAMLYHGAKAGAFGLKQVLMETLTCMRRSGADIIISYFTPQLLDWMQEERENNK